MANITLYGPSGAPFTKKVEGALVLKELGYRLVEPETPDDYRRWSPKTGLLPVIDVDGVRIQDSGRILDYLDRHFPEPPLVAADPKVATSQRRLENWVEETFLFYYANYLRALVEGTSEGVGYRRDLGAEFPKRLDDLVNFLGRRPFFYGSQPSRADLAVYSFVARIREAMGPEVGGELDARPALVAHLKRMDGLLKTPAALALRS